MKIYEIYSETKNNSVYFNIIEGSETQSMIHFVCGGRKNKIRKSTLDKLNITKDGFTYYTNVQQNFDLMTQAIKGTKDVKKVLDKQLKNLFEEKKTIIKRKKEVERNIKFYNNYMKKLATVKVMTDFRTKAKYKEKDFSNALKKL